MTQPHEPRARRRELFFQSVAQVVNFLLTCLTEDQLGLGTPLYERYLSRIFVPRKPPWTFHILMEGPPSLVSLVEQMATVQDGESRDYRALAEQAFTQRTIAQLLQGVLLQKVNAQDHRPDHVLLALWAATPETLSKILKHIWDLGARSLEIAFLKATAEALPSHLVRIFGLRHPSTFLSWNFTEGCAAELYAPLGTDRQHNRFYISWGYRYPLPGLDSVCELASELLLMRPGAVGKAPQWLVFAAGQVNFFRKPHEVLNLEVALDETAAITIEEEAQTSSIPLEVALIPRAGPGFRRILEIDKELDHRRRLLTDLERQRARLAAGDADEVYFAYCFDQDVEDRLNPLLIRFMQQRLGTLAHYDYSFCQEAEGCPYHLILANRSHRQLGFALQLADRVFYQPAQWRKWGINLFLPLGMELAPRLDHQDAVPLLLSLFTQTEEEPADNATAGSTGSLVDFPATLWQPGRDGTIVEVRVAYTRPLLEAYHVLNAFQRNLAEGISQATQEQLRAELRTAQASVTVDLDALERELLDYLQERLTAVLTTFGTLESDLAAAVKLVDHVGPKVQEVTKFVLNLPKEWNAFVNRVIELHRQIMDPALAAQTEFQNQVRQEHAALRALAARNSDLAASATRLNERMAANIAECDQYVQASSKRTNEIEQIAQRTGVVVEEIARLHTQLDERIEAIKQKEERARTMQAEIDQIKQREEQIAELLERLQSLRVEAEKVDAAVKLQEADARLQDEKLARRGEELLRRRQTVKDKTQRSVSQLAVVEERLATVAGQSSRMEQVFTRLEAEVDMISAHAEAVETWEKQRASWERFLSERKTALSTKVQQMQQAIANSAQHDLKIAQAVDHLKQAEQILQTLELEEPSHSDAAPKRRERVEDSR